MSNDFSESRAIQSRWPAQSDGEYFRKNDDIRIKINSLETLGLREDGRVFVSARLLLCFGQRPEDRCHDLGSTQGLEVKPNENKSFDGEDSKSLPALYSPTISGNQINQMVSQLPQSVRSQAPYFKIELRKTVKKGDQTMPIAVIGFKTNRVPAVSLEPTDSRRILNAPVEMRAIKDAAPYGAVVRILVRRP